MRGGIELVGHVDMLGALARQPRPAERGELVRDVERHEIEPAQGAHGLGQQPVLADVAQHRPQVLEVERDANSPGS